MTQFHLIFTFIVALTISACSSSPVESTVESTNKIPPRFKGSWQLVRISCASGELGATAESINASLSKDSKGTKLNLTINQVQNPEVISLVSRDPGDNTPVCTYSVSQKWEKTGHWVQVSSPASVKALDSSPAGCEVKKSELIASPAYTYMIPFGELSLASKNGLIHLYRTLGRSEKDLEICRASDRFIYELRELAP